MPLARLLRTLAAVAVGIFLGTPALAAQGTGTVTGVVVNAENGLTLAGVALEVPGTALRAVSRADGRFTILRVPAGGQSVQARYIGFAPQSVPVTVTSGGVARVRLELRPQAVEIEGIEVVGLQVGQAAALNQQLNAINVTNVVAADQIGRFPDANIGDALKRIPGISVQVDQGEARFGAIRGTEPRLNSVTINGERVPSAEAEVRSVQLDLIPADMVAAVEVNKVLTPDMDADAIGASVNIVTRSAPATRRASFTLGGGAGLLREEVGGIGSVVLAQRFLDDRLGVVLNGSYLDNEIGSDDLEAEWDEDAGSAFVSDLEVRRYDIRRLRRSVGASLDYRLGGASSLFYRGIYNHRNDWENRYRLRYRLDDPAADGTQETRLVRELKGGVPGTDLARLEDQRVQSHQFGGNFILGGATLDLSFTVARASEERPNERYLAFENGDAITTVGLGDPREPRPVVSGNAFNDLAAQEFDELTEEFQFTRDLDRNGRLDLTIPLGGGRSTLKVGGRYRDKSKNRDNSFVAYEPVSGLGSLADVPTENFTREGFLAGPYQSGNFATPTFLGGLDLTNPALFDAEDQPGEYLPGNFDATERIIGGYASLTQALSPRTTLLAGVRIENTDIDYEGFNFDLDEETAVPTAGAQTYTNLFPSLILRHELAERTVLRAAWTNTIARPNYYDLVPYRQVSFEDDELALGNPDLKPTKSMNFDLMVENYSRSVGLVSGGLFYKDITDFIYGYSRTDVLDPVTNTTFGQVFQPQNGASASLYGFEVAFQRRLIGGLSFYGNYTFTESSVDGFPITERATEDLPLPGTSKHTLNASLSYDTDRLSLRASLNFQDDFLDPDEGVGESAFFDRWYDRSTNVDVNAEVVVTPTTRVFVNANNLTNQPLRYYQGVRTRTMQGEYYNARFQAGVKIDLR